MRSSGQAPPTGPAPASDAVGTYEFGRFRLRPANRQLTDLDGKAVDLTAKAFDALTYLVMHPGRLISREEMTGHLWPHTIVEENNLNQTIWALRKALGDDSRQQRLIATVPGRGYQFVADVRIVPPLPAAMSSDEPDAVLTPDNNAAAVLATADAAPPRHAMGGISFGVAVAVIVVLGFAIAEVVRLPSGLEQSESPSLWTVTNRIPITSGPGYSYHPALSPDGTTVAYAQGNRGIHVQSVEGGESPRLLTPERAVHPAWSPNLDLIAFLRRLANYDYELQIVPVHGQAPPSPLVRLSMVDIGRFGWPIISWSSNARYVLFPSDAEADARDSGSTLIHAIDVETGEIWTLTRGDRVFDTSAALSPDASRIAFTRYNNNERLPVLMVQELNPDFSPRGEAFRVPVPPLGVDIHSVFWAHGGKVLTFVADRHIYQWQDGGIAESVYGSIGPFSGLSMVWIDGRVRAVGSRSSNQEDIRVLSLDPVTLSATGQATRRAISAATESYPRPSPDGSKLAFVSDRDRGEIALFVSDRDGSNAHRITTMRDAVSIFLPDWSPDGTHIAFAIATTGSHRVNIVNVDTRVTRDLGEGVMPAWSWPDGEYVYVAVPGERQSTPNTVARIHVANPTHQDNLFVGTVPKVAPDGTQIVYGDFERRGIFRRSLVDGVVQNDEQKLVDDFLPPLGGFVALADGVVYQSLTPENIPQAIYFYDNATGEPGKIAEAPGGVALGLAVSSDRRELLYSAPAFESGSDVVLFDFDPSEQR